MPQTILIQGSMGAGLLLMALFIPFVIIPFITALIRNISIQIKKNKNGFNENKRTLKSIVIVLGKSLLVALIGLAVLLLLFLLMFWNTEFD